MLEIRKVNKKFKNFELQDISLKLKEGNIYYLFGKNGSGKTTLFKIILDLIEFDSGKIFYPENKKDFINHCGVLPDYPIFYDDYSAYDNIKILVGKFDDDDLYNMCDEFDFKRDYLKNKLKSLSLGQRRLISIFILLLKDYRYYLLDEPSIGLDYFTFKVFKEKIIKLKKDSIIIITGHDYQSLYDLSDKLIHIEAGKINYFGEKTNFLDSECSFYEKIIKMST